MIKIGSHKRKTSLSWNRCFGVTQQGTSSNKIMRMIINFVDYDGNQRESWFWLGLHFPFTVEFILLTKAAHTQLPVVWRLYISCYDEQFYLPGCYHTPLESELGMVYYRGKTSHTELWVNRCICVYTYMASTYIDWEFTQRGNVCCHQNTFLQTVIA